MLFGISNECIVNVEMLPLWIHNTHDREKSLAKQSEHRARLEEIQEQKKERTAFRKKDWEAKQMKLQQERLGKADLLVKDAGNWVTEDNLDEHIERAVDAFFIAGAGAKQEVGEVL